MARSILVTGGAGFVGSHLCRTLAAAGDAVMALDNLQNGLRTNIPKGVEFVRADVGDRRFMERLRGRRFDAVIHCAAQSSNAISFKDPHLDAMSNQIGTLNVLASCEALQVSRLVFTSSMSIYGEAERLPTPESEPPRPLSPYAVHKVASEQYIRLLAPGRRLQATIFRLYTTYGPGQNLANRDQGLVSIYLSYLLRGEPVVVKGSGARRRDVVYIDDVARAILLALDAPVTFGKTYNVGSGEAHPIADVLRWLVEAAEMPADYPITYEPGTPGDPHATHADINLLQNDLHWTPEVSAKEGITRTVRAYRSAAVRVGDEGV